MPGIEQTQALLVLAYLMFRMGREESAERLYKGLLALSENSRADADARAGLAAIAIEKGDGAAALAYLAPVLKNAALSSVQAVLLLLKAQALWLEKREAEARAALNDYLLLSAGKKEGA